MLGGGKIRGENPVFLIFPENQPSWTEAVNPWGVPSSMSWTRRLQPSSQWT